MSEDIKNAIQDMGKTFEEFKKVNDQRLDSIEKGESTAYVDEKIARMEAKMDSYEDINQKLTTAELNADNIKSQIDKLETIVTRPNSGFESKQVDEYMGAFDSYCRKGIEGLDVAEKKALTVSNDSTGGYLAPPEYVKELIKDITEISPIRSIARIRSTGSRSIQIPKRTVRLNSIPKNEMGKINYEKLKFLFR